LIDYYSVLPGIILLFKIMIIHGAVDCN